MYNEMAKVTAQLKNELEDLDSEYEKADRLNQMQKRSAIAEKIRAKTKHLNRLQKILDKRKLRL